MFAAWANFNPPSVQQDVESNGIQLPFHPPASHPVPYGHLRTGVGSTKRLLLDEWQVILNAVLLPPTPPYLPQCRSINPNDALLTPALSYLPFLSYVLG